MGPMGAGEILSCDIRFKTTASRERVLIFYGGRFGHSRIKDIFLLTLQNGNMRLYLEKKSYVEPKADILLNDGVWHSILISMPSKSSLYSDINIFIDGEKVQTKLRGKEDKNVFFTTSGHVSVGGFGYSNQVYGQSIFKSMKNFEGEISNFRVWNGVSIEATMIETQHPSSAPSISRHPSLSPVYTTSSPSSAPVTPQPTKPETLIIGAATSGASVLHFRFLTKILLSSVLLALLLY